MREHSQYQAQLVETRAAIIGAFYKLQVDFGLMSWQQYDQSRQPEPLFSPLDPVKKWLTRQDTARQQSDQVIIQPIVMKEASSDNKDDTGLVTYPLNDPNYP